MQFQDSSPASLISQLQSPDTALPALKRIKNGLIGHETQKATFVELGLVEALSNLLDVDTENDEKQLEVGAILGSLAYGGAPFMGRLITAGVIPKLIATLNPGRSSPKVVLSSLKTLNIILDSCPSYTQPAGSLPAPSTVVIAEIYRRSNTQSIQHFRDILSQESPASIVQQQVTALATLISKTCYYKDYLDDGEGRAEVPPPEDRRTLLVENGVLNVLVHRMGAFIVKDLSRDDISLDGKPLPVITNGHRTKSGNRNYTVLPSALASDDTFGRLSTMDPLVDRPRPASLTARLGPILDAITAITWESISNMQAVHKAEWLPEVAKIGPTESGNEKAQAPAPEPEPMPFLNPAAFPPLSAAILARNRSFTRFPSMPASAAETPSRHSPVPHVRPTRHLIGSPTSEDLLFTLDDANGRSPTGSVEERIESPLIPWLTARIRMGDAYTRMCAIAFIVNLFRVGMITKKAVKSVLIPLVIPVLLSLIEEAAQPPTVVSKDLSGKPSGGLSLGPIEQRVVLERGPMILGTLLLENETLTKVLVDAGVIQKLSKILKVVMESPNPKDETEMCSLHASGMAAANNLQRIHRLKTTEAILQCLANIGVFKDKYRKAIIGEKIMPCLMAAMRPMGAAPEKATIEDVYVNEGNPPGVLIAACSVLQSISRSVSILRTSLIDAQVQEPLFVLLNNKNIQVRIASTAVVCNLVLDYSPMAKPLYEAGVVKILAGHTHSGNAALCENALWALKHLVYTGEFDVKDLCYSELGSEWLFKLITDERAVRNDPARYDNDGDEGMADVEEDTGGGVPVKGLTLEDLEKNKYGYRPVFPPLSQAALPNPDAYSSAKASQYAAIQEHALDFLRNLFTGDYAAKFIDKVFADIGRERLFEALSSKIRPRIYPATSEQDLMYRAVYENPPEMMASVIYITAHLAASSEPRHKQMVIDQKDFLRLLRKLADHPSPTIRVGLLWVLINITANESLDGGETMSVVERTRALKQLGFEEVLAKLKGDEDLDVRERVKTALQQMSEAMRLMG